MAKDYSAFDIDRRIFMQRLITAAGGCALGDHLMTERGFALPLHARSTSADNCVEAMLFKYPGDGVTLEGYLVRPRENGTYPGCLLVSVERGLSDNVRDAAWRLANEERVVLVPDLLSRMGGTASFSTPGHAAAVLAHMQEDDIVRDLNATLEYLSTYSAVERDNIAVMFLGWGRRSRNFLPDALRRPGKWLY